MIDNNFQLHFQLKADSHILGHFPLSLLLLMNDKQFPWFVLVPQVNQVKEIYQLTAKQQQQFLQESNQLSSVIMQQWQGDKLNLAALGNMVSQLHIHHIVRFKGDLAWPAPVWGKAKMVPYEPSQVVNIQAKISPLLSEFTPNQL
ncbi:HIT domain-containing protein [Aliikangiella sp. IMCC44653]